MCGSCRWSSGDYRIGLTAEELEAAITPKTKLLVLPFPNNPTGAIMTREDLEKIAEIVEEHDLFVLSDEIYGELTYGEEPHVTIASIPGMRDRTILINGFSKAFAMTWICVRTGDYLKADAQDSPVCDHVCTYDKPVCGSRCTQEQR